MDGRVKMDSSTVSVRFDQASQILEHSLLARGERPGGPISRVVGLYQSLLRRTLEHFFPDTLLETEGDRSQINWDGADDDSTFQIGDDGDGMGLRIEWLGTRLNFRPQSPVPLLPLERMLIDSIVRALDLRFAASSTRKSSIAWSDSST